MDYGLVIGLCWLAFFLAWTIGAMVFGGARGRQSSAAAIGIRALLLVTVLASVRYGARLDVRLFGDQAEYFAKAGVALCIVGLTFAIWARIALGRSWGMPMTVHADPELVVRGPYRFVRHPIYTGLTTMFIGTSLVYPLFAISSAVVIAYSVLSALREERDMEQRFPNSYPDYKKRSKMLVPFLL
ncbi:MAG TPA: isoprenylcysteine carboxylmethyltransferase family protein [Gammaproteobacteria bacterium]|nr:isoprenylcysteine carboxylmethyltransferase family protein [Gammaproteobacteria bacterium]